MGLGFICFSLLFVTLKFMNRWMDGKEDTDVGVLNQGGVGVRFGMTFIS